MKLQNILCTIFVCVNTISFNFNCYWKMLKKYDRFTLWLLKIKADDKFFMIYILLCSLFPIIIILLRKLDFLINRGIQILLPSCVPVLVAQIVSSAVLFAGMKSCGMKMEIILSLFICSICFGPILAKIWSVGDLSKSGSGNIGATNMMRLGGAKLGALTLLLDGAKGFLLVMYFQFYCDFEAIEHIVSVIKAKELILFLGDVLKYNMNYGAMTYLPSKQGWFFALFATAMHIRPLYSSIKGGKGVAVFFGAVFATENRNVALLICAVWIVAFMLWHISSISALLSALFLLFFKLIKSFLLQAKIYITIGADPVFRIETHSLSSFVNLWPALMVVLLICIAHKDNIVRILKGEERRSFMKVQ